MCFFSSKFPFDLEIFKNWRKFSFSFGQEKQSIEDEVRRMQKHNTTLEQSNKKLSKVCGKNIVLFSHPYFVDFRTSETFFVCLGERNSCKRIGE